MDDVDFLYSWSAKIKKRPTSQDEEMFEQFIEDFLAQGYTKSLSRIKAFEKLYEQN